MLRIVLFLLILQLVTTSLILAEEGFNPPAPDRTRYKSIFNSMTRREKIAQLIMAYANVELVRKYQVGSVIFMGWQIKNQKQIKKFISGVQQKSKIPCMIATDEEGGRVNRFRIFRDARHPSAREVGSNIRSGKWDLQKVRENAYRVGMTISSIGVNANLAPVLDVSRRGLMKAQGRCYSIEQEEVRDIGRAFIQGFRDAGVICIAKHYPGYGELALTTDRYLLKDRRTWENIEDDHIKPFEENKDVLGGLMLANIWFNLIDREHLASFSPVFIKRARADFPHGLLMTDDLRAKSVVELSKDNIEQIAQVAFLAGLDIFLTIKNANVPRIINGIEYLLENQPELEIHLEESLARQFAYKEVWYNDFFKERIDKGNEEQN
ncbi:MAG: hypothetical protein JXA60_11865 [Candidatus Coatesbacteria bacterium]|nr:hypothetical protein [Candidatus Coatesbacteria bacterium]